MSHLADKIELIDGTMGNCYSVSFKRKLVLVDAGTKGSGKKIISYYDGLKKKPSIVLITHYHPDHIGGLRLIQEKFKPEIYVPEGEVEVVAGRSQATPARGLFSRMVAGMMKTDPVTEIKPSSELVVPGIETILTEGHTPGSTSYYFPSLKAVFVGDAIVTKHGQATVNKAFTLDIDAALRSKDRLLSMSGITLYPGHGEPLVLKENTKT